MFWAFLLYQHAGHQQEQLQTSSGKSSSVLLYCIQERFAQFARATEPLSQRNQTMRPSQPQIVGALKQLAAEPSYKRAWITDDNIVDLIKGFPEFKDWDLTKRALNTAVRRRLPSTDTEATNSLGIYTEEQINRLAIFTQYNYNNITVHNILILHCCMLSPSSLVHWKLQAIPCDEGTVTPTFAIHLWKRDGRRRTF